MHYDLNALRLTLRRAGLTPTEPRLAIYRYLLEHPGHPTIEEVYSALLEEVPSLSKTTVYNTFHSLSKSGLLRPVFIDEKQIRFDAEIGPHAHFLCEKCGRIYNLPLPRFEMDENALFGYDVHSQDVYLRGVCPACQEVETDAPLQTMRG